MICYLLQYGCAVIFVAGYGVQAGPTHGQQMKGIGMNHVFSLRTHAYVSCTHTHIHWATALIKYNVLYVAGYGAQAGGYGGQGAKGNGILDVMM